MTRTIGIADENRQAENPRLDSAGFSLIRPSVSRPTSTNRLQKHPRGHYKIGRPIAGTRVKCAMRREGADIE
ncbi:hypothetical protein [Burkholderia gladioli]|uniref:Uncharacterized protein n=1 Tax=Burkholderia gladioli TaxID=28095 RepID=A0AB38TT57_BURGA|nr:hypothetical protein [Burkholderia gladioli]MBU9270530.1 hypothetical protein [Burkholderia gladioli]UWX71142.1 hypothetical protein NYZ96_05105 [Burkholderia gladioli]